MTVPDFLVIGAMKAGTTSLYLDLSQHPAIFFPNLKEPGNLARDDVLTTEGGAAYASLFQHAQPGQRSGDASTDYAKLPDVAGVAARARSVLGPELRLVYLVREPVSRAVSHHHHLVARGLAPESFEAARDAVPSLVDYGCYAMQLEPWIDAFGAASALVARFEDYTADRRVTVDQVFAHIGVAPLPSLNVDEVGNRSDVDPPATGRSAWLRDNRLYRRMLRPLVPEATRVRLRRALLAAPPARPEPPRLATVQSMVARFDVEERRLRAMIGRLEPLWAFDDVVAQSADSDRARP